MDHVKITYSNGRGRSGQRYAYIRPAQKCFNRSRRCRVDQVEKIIQTHYPEIFYYLIDGYVIGAKDIESAHKEYWKVCERNKIKKRFPIRLIES